MTHFFSGEEEPAALTTTTTEDCGSSLSSGFSDENNEVEEFEQSTALRTFKKIHEKLQDEEIMDACKGHQFNLDDEGCVDLRDMFYSSL